MNELGVHNPANGVAELGLGEASRVFITSTKANCTKRRSATAKPS